MPLELNILNNFVVNSTKWITPEYWLLISVGIVLVYGTVAHTHSAGSLSKMHVLTTIVLCGALLLTFAGMQDTALHAVTELSSGSAWISARYKHDNLVECLLLIISIIIVCASYRYNKGSGILSFEYYVMVLICVFSFCAFVHADNLITLYMLVELQSISSYVLTAINRYQRHSIEAGLKYFILGSFSSVILLFGISFTYGFTGLVCISDISLYVRNVGSDCEHAYLYATLLSVLLMNVGFLFKIYAAPFHFWVGDIYQGAPMSVTMFLSTVPVISYVYVFIKLYVCVLSDITTLYSYILNFFAIMSIVFGTLGALIQQKLKRLIAYSSVSTIGFILACLSGNSIMLIQQCLQYIFLYVLNIIPIFIIILSFRVNDSDCIDDIRQLSALYSQNKYVFILLCISVFSLAGIPPFSGFVAKLGILTALGREHKYLLIIVGVVATVLSCYYYVRIAKMIIYDAPVCTHFYSRPTYAAVWCATSLVSINILYVAVSPWFDSLFEYIAIRLYS